MITDFDKRTRVKICGLTNLEDARFASGALADFLGFIFYEKSPRYVEPAKAGAIINWIEGPRTVGVFVNQPLDDVNMIARETGVDLIQLHGNESPDYCRLIEKPIIKAFHVDADKSSDELNKEIEPYVDLIEYLLFDTRSKSKWGGTGQTFEWDILKEISIDIPIFLSGGLKRANVLQACERVRPFAVDLSSGVEKAPGIKDFDKIEAFFDEMRKGRSES